MVTKMIILSRLDPTAYCLSTWETQGCLTCGSLLLLPPPPSRGAGTALRLRGGIADEYTGSVDKFRNRFLELFGSQDAGQQPKQDSDDDEILDAGGYTGSNFKLPDGHNIWPKDDEPQSRRGAVSAKDEAGARWEFGDHLEFDLKSLVQEGHQPDTDKYVEMFESAAARGERLNEDVIEEEEDEHGNVRTMRVVRVDLRDEGDATDPSRGLPELSLPEGVVPPPPPAPPEEEETFMGLGREACEALMKHMEGENAAGRGQGDPLSYISWLQQLPPTEQRFWPIPPALLPAPR